MSVRLVTLGELRCFHNGVETELPKQRLRFGMLVYLAMERSAPREKLAALFWPEVDDERARRRMNQVVYEIRQTFGNDCIETWGDELRALPSLTIDAHDFGVLADSGDYAGALELYRRHFLDGFFIDGAEDWQHWADRRRTVLAATFAQASRLHINTLLARNEPAEAAKYAARWGELDPHTEDDDELLMLALARSGRRAEALNHFVAYKQRLAAEQEEPGARIEALAEQIREGAFDPAPPPHTLALPPALDTPQPTIPVPVRADSFWGELKRRRVVRVAAVYAAVAVVVIQFATDVFPVLGLPDWTTTFAIVAALLGFPVALVLSWAFDITPDPLSRPRTPRRISRPRQLAVGAFTLVLAAGLLAFTTDAGQNLFHDVIGLRITCPDGSRPPCEVAPPLDPESYAVLPLAHVSGTDPVLDGEICARLITEGLAQWEDLKLADGMRLSDALRRRDAGFRQQIPVDSGIALARSVGAGRVIMGRVWHYADTTHVEAVLYDVERAAVVRRAETRFAVSGSNALAFYQLADSLLLAGRARSGLNAGSTSSLAALQSFDEGAKALYDWNLRRAAERFSNAAEKDPIYAEAYLWAAQAMSWAGDTTDAWRGHAQRAAALRARLSANEALLADGMAALAQRRYVEACDAFRAVLARAPDDFAALIGLGDCNGWDPIVVPDPASASGWAFRGSQHTAVESYVRALTLVPSYNFAVRNLTSSRLGGALFLNAARRRIGYPEGSAATVYAARPALTSDTLAFTPYPIREVNLGAAGTTPPTRMAALDRNRRLLVDAATHWARAYPDNADAYAALAYGLELTGRLTGTKSAETSALVAVRRARKLTKDDAQAIRLGIAEVRLLVKGEEYKKAEKLARSILRAQKDPDPSDAESLASLAALTGRVHLMSRLLALSAAVAEPEQTLSGTEVTPPLPLSELGLRLRAYASFAAPVDSMRVLSARVHNIIETSIAEDRRRAMHEALLDNASEMLFPVLGADLHGSPALSSLVAASQHALSAGDTATARARMARLDSLSRHLPPGEIAVDYTFRATQVLLALGDTTAAVRKMDALLNALWTITPVNFSRPYQTAALGRMMALRADLALRSGDRATARRWAAAVRTLWSRADSELRSTMPRSGNLLN